MGRTSSNRTSNSLLNLALAAFYLNLTIKNADGSQFYQVGPVMPIALPAFEASPLPWPDSLGRYSQAGSQGFQGYGDNYKGALGYRDGNGYYDDLMSTRNAYDIGKAYGGGQDYGKGAVAGGGYRDLSGRNKGHKAAGFSNSYRKDESGDQSTYYDDGLGHNAKINYAAQDARETPPQKDFGAQAVRDTVEGLLDKFLTILSSPILQGKGNVTRIEKEQKLDPNTTLTQGFRDQGGLAGRGGYHDTNLNRNAIANNGRYGDNYNYKGYTGGARGYSGGGGFGVDKGYAGYSNYPLTKGFSGFPSAKGYTDYSMAKGFSGYPITKGFSGYPTAFGPSYHRHGRVLPSPAPNDKLMPPPLPGPPGTTIKETGIYVIPMPDKLFFDPAPEM